MHTQLANCHCLCYTHVFNHEPNVRHQIRYHCAVRQETSSNQMQLFRFQVCAECTLDWQTVSYMHAFNYESNVMNNLPYKTGLDVMQSHPLYRTRFGQCQPSSAACVVHMCHFWTTTRSKRKHHHLWHYEGKQKTAAMLVYNEIGTSMAIFTK